MRPPIAVSKLPLLTRRELNRATLARQLLLQRSSAGLLQAMARLGPLQAQYSPSPYCSLWSRLHNFELADLTRAIRRRAVFKATLLRGTLHLLTAREHSFYSAILAHVGARHWETEAARAGIPAERMRASIDAHLREPRTIHEVVAHLASLSKGRTHAASFVRWRLVVAHGGLVHEYPSGTWRTFGSARLQVADDGRPPVEPQVAFAHVARRYLAGFGPATRADLGAWSGVPAKHWAPALDAMVPTLRRFRDEQGRELLDLPRAPRPDADTPAPVRFLHKWDSLLLGFADRTRVIAREHAKVIVAPNGDFASTVLIDGEVGALWTVERRGTLATLRITPMRRIPRSERAALLDEGERLVRFIEPDAGSFAVRA